jgi:hypothetical protein
VNASLTTVHAPAPGSAWTVPALLDELSEWQMDLHHAIAGRGRVTPFKAQSLPVLEHSPVQQWLGSREALAFRRRAEYGEVSRTLVTFHRELAWVEHLLEQQQFGEAVLALRTNSSYSLACRRLRAALIALGRVQRLLGAMGLEEAMPLLRRA